MSLGCGETGHPAGFEIRLLPCEFSAPPQSGAVAVPVLPATIDPFRLTVFFRLRKGAAAVGCDVRRDRRAEDVGVRPREADDVDSAPVEAGAVTGDRAVDDAQLGARYRIDPATPFTGAAQSDIAGHGAVDDGQIRGPNHVEAAPAGSAVAAHRRADHRRLGGVPDLDTTAGDHICPASDRHPVEGGDRGAEELEDAVDSTGVNRGSGRIPNDRHANRIGDVEVSARRRLLARWPQGECVLTGGERDRVDAASRRTSIHGGIRVGGADGLAQRAVAVRRVVVGERVGFDGGGESRRGLKQRGEGRNADRSRTKPADLDLAFDLGARCGHFCLVEPRRPATRLSRRN